MGRGHTKRRTGRDAQTSYMEMFMPNVEIAEIVLLAGIQKRARARVAVRMATYGRDHMLTKQATKTSLAITNLIQSKSVHLEGVER